MDELYNSEAFTLKYDSDTESCAFILKSYGDRDNFRTPMMHAVEMIRKYKCRNLIIENSSDEQGTKGEISEVDLKWVKRIIIPKLADSSCEHIFFVVDDGKEGTPCDDMPYSLFADKFKTDKVVSEQFALMMIRNGAAGEVSSDISQMTKADALDYMGLPANANDFAIDEKFWVLSKNLRGDNTPEGKKKLSELSAVYDIASGRRDERVQKEEQREQERKFLGKTGDEWRTYFSYTWYKYLIGIILIYLAGNLIYTIVSRPGYDSGVLSIGHFSNESDYIERFMTTRLGFENPMIGVVDMVVPNDQDQSQSAYADQSAATMILSCPNVIVYDEATMPYYFSNLADLSSLYGFLRENLTSEQMSKIEPVFMSEREAQHILNQYEVSYGAELNVDDNLLLYDDTTVLVGLEITDPDAIRILGYENLWPETKPTLVFTIYSQSMDYSDSEFIIMELLKAVL